MVKSKKVWSVTAGFVGAAGLAALATGANTVSASTSGTVNYKSGATTVWNSPSWNHVKRYVTFGDTVQLLGKTVDRNGATWYKVGDNQWIPELYLNVDGKTAQVEAPASTASQAPTSQAPASQAPASQATTATAPAATQSANIQLYVKNVGSAVTVWATPAYGRATGQYLEGQQSVTAVAQQQANGETWYQLSNGGYVPARFVSTTPVAAAPQSTAPQPTASSAAAQPAASQAPASSSAAQPSQAPASQAQASSAAAQPSQAPVSQAPASSSAAQSQAPAASQAPASSSAAPASQASTTPVAASYTAPQTQQLSQQSNNNNATTQTQTATATSSSRQAKIQAVIAIAEQQIGVPYVWGGKTPAGFDCSGLMYYAFLHGTGVNIGGWTVPQESSGTQVSLDALQPGDLLFWGSHGSTYHVALYIGGGTMIQAPQPGENVKYTALAYFQPDFAVRPNL